MQRFITTTAEIIVAIANATGIEVLAGMGRVHESMREVYSHSAFAGKPRFDRDDRADHRLARLPRLGKLLSWSGFDAALKRVVPVQVAVPVVQASQANLCWRLLADQTCPQRSIDRSRRLG